MAASGQRCTAPAHNSFQEWYRLCEIGDFGVGFRRFALSPAA